MSDDVFKLGNFEGLRDENLDELDEVAAPEAKLTETKSDIIGVLSCQLRGSDSGVMSRTA